MTDALTQWNQVLMNNYGTPPIELVSGKGATVQDSQGRVHIDMLAGIAVNALGHAHPAIIEAVSHQLSQLGHVSNLFATRPVVQLAETLKERVGDDSARVFFCNSGGEANEAAFKLARLTGRSRVLAAVDGFHGRTMGSLALTPEKGSRARFAAEAGTAGYITRERCFANNVVMRHVYDRMIISPPLVITPAQIDVLIERATKAFDEAYAQIKAEGLLKAA